MNAKPRPAFGTANTPSAVAAPGSLRLLGPKDLPAKGIPFNANHLRRLWTLGKFPKPTYLSARRYAWPETVIDAWLNEKIANSSRGRS